MKLKHLLFFKVLIATAFLGLTITMGVTGQVTLRHSYTFEDGTANDGTGTVNGTIMGTGTIAGGIYTSAANGDYIKFSGAALALSTYSAITQEVYLRAGNASNPGWTMLTYFGGANGTNAYFVSIARNDNISRTEYVDGASVSGAELEDGKLHHIVSILTDSTITFYIDGALIGEAKHSKAISDIATDTAMLCAGGWPDPSWLGSIHEYNIYEGSMDVATIEANAATFLSASDDKLSDLTADAGTITPAFDPLVSHFAIEVPSGTATVNITATPNNSSATVTGGGAVDLSGGETTDTIKVTSADGTAERIYTIDIKFEEDCFVPLFDDGRTNFVSVPTLDSLTGIGGWGSKSIVYGFEAYCGLGAAKLVDAAGSGCTAALDLSDFAWKSNTVYHLRAMVKTVGGSIGILARGSGNVDGEDFGFAYDTEGEWVELDTIFMTGTAARTGFFSFNTCDFGSNCTATYIDNYELYEISNDATLSDIKVNDVSIDGFRADSMIYNVGLPYGTTSVPAVTATTANVNAAAVVTPAAGLSDSTVIVVTAEDDSATLTYVVKFTILPTAIEDAETVSVLLYPTISNGTFTVITNGLNTNIMVYDLSGNLVVQQKGNAKQIVSVPKAGMYFVKVECNDITRIFKVVKTN
ncbi:MAG: T9SS type A sorting domain-containing protein [Bacteroidales bacterium]|nr:T9SS type A sorting domain-containing protein [Bacteroidales bacterium]